MFDPIKNKKHGEQLLSMNQIAIMFLSQRDKSFKELMDDGVSQILDAVGADGLSVWRNSVKSGGLHTSAIYEYGTTPSNLKATEFFNDIKYSDYIRNWEEPLSNGEYINGPASSMLPEETALLNKFRVASVFIVPVFIDGGFWGFVLFGNTYDEKYYGEDCAALMTSAAFLFVNALIREELEQSAAEAEKRMNIMLDSAPMNCQIWDKNINCIDCNEAAVKLFGLKDKQEYIDNFFRLSPEYQPDGRATSEAAQYYVNKALEDGRCEFDWEHQTLDGEPIAVNTLLVRVEHGDGYMIAGYTKDMREHNRILNEKKLQDELLSEALEKALAANHAKSAFLSNMSHEMRTPMNAIIGMTAIGKKVEDAGRKNRALDKIEESSEHLLGLINNILDVTKIEADRMELINDSFFLSKLLKRAVSFMRLNLEGKQIKFTMNAGDMPDEFTGDDKRLLQALTNLLSNAVKFTPEGGAISLDVSMRGEKDGLCELRFEVADNGIGITPEMTERIFMAFEQAESGTTRKYGGTGLGLYITKRIVELMGGEIYVESEIGKGSRFIFTVKLRRETNQTYTPPESADGTDGEFTGKKLLLAEDNETNAEILISLLEGTGMAIDVAENGKKCLDTVTESPNYYDLIFMDVQMPVMDGLEATRRIREITKELPIIAVTANVFKEDIDACIGSGMDDHIGKPIDIDIILEKLRKYLKVS